MKTPVQLAAEWYWKNLTEQAPVVMLSNPVKYPPCPRKAFVAGYEAGQRDMQTQLAVGEDVVRELLDAPKWISVKDRLPEIGTPCLVTCHEERYTIAEYDGIKWTTLNHIAYYHPIVTHWQLLLEIPKG